MEWNRVAYAGDAIEENDTHVTECDTPTKRTTTNGRPVNWDCCRVCNDEWPINCAPIGHEEMTSEKMHFCSIVTVTSTCMCSSIQWLPCNQFVFFRHFSKTTEIRRINENVQTALASTRLPINKAPTKINISLVRRHTHKTINYKLQTQQKNLLCMRKAHSHTHATARKWWLMTEQTIARGPLHWKIAATEIIFLINNNSNNLKRQNRIRKATNPLWTSRIELLYYYCISVWRDQHSLEWSAWRR